MTALPITLGALGINSDTPTSGVTWGVSEMDGWDAPAVRASSSPVSGHHGGYLLGSQWEPRTVTLRGHFDADTWEAFWAAHALVPTLVGLTEPVTLTVHEPAPKSLQVIQGGRPLVSLAHGGFLHAEWSLSLLALDPFKRGAAHSVTLAAGASTTVTYAGTFPGAPLVTLAGAGTVDVAISTTGTRVRTSSLPSGAVIDSHEPGHTVYAGTTNRYDALVQPVSWLRLQPGDNAVTNTGTAPVVLDYYDTYL